jgi:hypothetical protein
MTDRKKSVVFAFKENGKIGKRKTKEKEEGKMKINFIIAGIIAAGVSFFTLNLSADSESFETHTRVGNGWHMYTTMYLTEDGVINGKTTLKNYNNFRGFTGGLFVVALDENNNPVYTTGVHKWGINASFFKKKVTRNAEWSDCIPQEYLPKVAKIAVMQMHAPTNRVWSWVYNNRDLIIDHAKFVAELFKKYQNDDLTGEDVMEIIEAHL